jgi:AraC-like DNA-binding protein/mannose-6-phosphate isomerase-like protein (cupin superfamily)
MIDCPVEIWIFMNPRDRLRPVRINESNEYIHFLGDRLWVITERDYRSEDLTPLYVDRYSGPRENPRMDFHDNWELFVVFSGRGRIVGTDSRADLKPHCSCLIPPGIKHAELSDEPMDALWVGLRGRLFERVDRATMLVSCGEDMTNYAEQLWLRSLNPFGPIGPELDGVAAALTGAFFRLLSTSNSYSYSGMEEIVLHINKNYMNDLSIGILSAKLGYSDSYFHRSFKKHTGRTPIEYVTSVRVQNAVRLLRSTSLSVKRISSMVGFGDPLYFSKVFKRITGDSPKAFR